MKCAAILLACVAVTWPGVSRAQAPSSGHQHAPAAAEPPPEAPPAQERLPPFIPRVTDADRQAAFPEVDGHTVHDAAVHTFVLVDQLEVQAGDGANGVSWDARGWIGGDTDRFWFRTEGDRAGGRVEHAQTDLLYGRAMARWWDVTAGVRLDTLPDAPRTAVALGVRGLAPYRIEIEASGYVEFSGRPHVRFEAEHDLLLTNRLVLQPLLELEIYGRGDPERRLGAGLTATDLGLRVRYEIRRELAPYVGVTWTRRYFATADYARRDGLPASGARLVAGVRLWK